MIQYHYDIKGNSPYWVIGRYEGTSCKLRPFYFKIDAERYIDKLVQNERPPRLSEKELKEILDDIEEYDSFLFSQL
jgi:hypothetical protein